MLTCGILLVTDRRLGKKIVLALPDDRLFRAGCLVCTGFAIVVDHGFERHTGVLLDRLAKRGSGGTRRSSGILVVVPLLVLFLLVMGVSLVFSVSRSGKWYRVLLKVQRRGGTDEMRGDDNLGRSWLQRWMMIGLHGGDAVCRIRTDHCSQKVLEI